MNFDANYVKSILHGDEVVVAHVLVNPLNSSVEIFNTAR